MASSVKVLQYCENGGGRGSGIGVGKGVWRERDVCRSVGRSEKGCHVIMYCLLLHCVGLTDDLVGNEAPERKTEERVGGRGRATM